MNDKTKLEILNTKFRKKDLDKFYYENIYHDHLLDYPLVYLLRNKRNIYIGETSNLKSRMYDHYKKVGNTKFNELDVIYHPKFNKSATYNIETNLIHHISSDSGVLRTTNESQTKIKQTHNYYEKRFFHKELFEYIWDNLREKELVIDSIDEIQDKDIYKISPYTLLNEEQMSVREKIVNFCIKYKNNDNGAVLLINGEAGTGKSVLLSSTFKRIMDESVDPSSPLFEMANNYVLVNHEEMLKTYRKIAKKVPGFTAKKFLKPTIFINRIDRMQEENLTDNKADIVLIDEAHLLLSRQDSYNNFRYENQLEEIIKRSRIAIVIFDDKQVLKAKSYWDINDFNSLVDGREFEKYELNTQMRMNANEYSNKWINDFVAKKVTPIPKDKNFEIKIFSVATEMHDAIRKKERTGRLSRVVSTFDYIHKKNKEIHYVEEGDFKLPWNNIYKETWAEERATINEVGSIYTVQGFDLNYVGVILGPSITYDFETESIVVDTSKYKDIEAFKNIGDIRNYKGELIDPELIKEQIILNSVNVLMKRGIKGLYIYASNDSLRKKLESINL